MRIISGALILISLYLGISHVSRAFRKPSEEYIRMMSALGIPDAIRIVFGVWAITSALLIMFPRWFFWGNTLRAVQLIVMMALALKAGNYKFALIEVPFFDRAFVADLFRASL
ncbi:hypothetical protein FMM05_00460 [Flavobacterium zepuense]|uniref:DoxX family protein n=1 Tax=Flavobacterium zepuense TaxID=2593302 RepID=A0A552V9L1_9FLAO|nr:DoxX family protein [Flavobacterium zepuense]TRW27154.1 hypothetical protein FMM05_00460 [Flavobacterium zepuense]